MPYKLSQMFVSNMPDWKEEVRKRLSGLNLAPAHEVEIVEELAQHIEDVYERALRSGVTELEARRTAIQELSEASPLLNEIRRSNNPAPVVQEPGGPTC